MIVHNKIRVDKERDVLCLRLLCAVLSDHVLHGGTISRVISSRPNHGYHRSFMLVGLTINSGLSAS